MPRQQMPREAWVQAPDLALVRARTQGDGPWQRRKWTFH
jgi:hypothetical protein